MTIPLYKPLIPLERALRKQLWGQAKEELCVQLYEQLNEPLKRHLLDQLRGFIWGR